MNKHEYAVIAAPFCRLAIHTVYGQLTGIDFLPMDVPLIDTEDAATQGICLRLQGYFEKRDDLHSLPVQLAGTPFQQRVWHALQQIPYGLTLTYSQLAEQIGSGPRAVANACGANRIPLVIPCHRVVARNGLGGFMQGRRSEALSIKLWLLNHERNQSNPAG